MIINNFSRVIPSKNKNLSPIVLNLNDQINKLSGVYNSEINSCGEINLYHFGGLWNLFNFLKNLFLNKKSKDIIFFHGTDLHFYINDLSFLNKTKAFLNRISNYILMYYSDSIFIVSNSLLEFIPNNFKTKTFIINLGVDNLIIKNIKDPFIEKKQEISFVNNNNRKLKNYPLAKYYSKTNNLNLNNFHNLNYLDFLKELNKNKYIIITSFQEGSPNVLKEAILLDVIPIAVNVGDCKDIIERFGGIIINYNGELINQILPNQSYNKEKYLSIEKTIKVLEILINE